MSPSRFQRNYPPQRYRPQTTRPSVGAPSASVASAAAPVPYQSAPEASSDARLCLLEQLRAFSRSPTPIDAVPPVPHQRMQSLWPIDRGRSTKVPRSDRSTTSAPAARLYRREGSSCEPYQRRDSYHQPFHQAGRDWALGSQRPIIPPVSVYLAASPSADRPLAERPREPFDDEIEQLIAQFERAKALKAATAAPQQQAALSRCFVKLPISYG